MLLKCWTVLKTVLRNHELPLYNHDHCNPLDFWLLWPPVWPRPRIPPPALTRPTLCAPASGFSPRTPSPSEPPSQPPSRLWTRPPLRSPLPTATTAPQPSCLPLSSRSSNPLPCLPVPLILLSGHHHHTTTITTTRTATLTVATATDTPASTIITTCTSWPPLPSVTAIGIFNDF